jgi:hypothetical protein
MEYLNHVVLGTLTMAALTLPSIENLYVTVQCQNMSGMISQDSYGNATTTPDKREIYVRDSQAISLEGRTIPSQGFIHLYDSTPFVITNRRIAINVPCEDNSAASLKGLISLAPNFTNAELENVPQLLNSGTMCHVDIPPQNLTVVDIAIKSW